MSDIQQARDVLAKWREAVDKGAFEALLDAHQDPETGYWDYAEPKSGAHLIFGTAGNPDLLDAIDGLLFEFHRVPVRHVPASIVSIAATIIAADERMSA